MRIHRRLDVSDQLIEKQREKKNYAHDKRYMQEYKETARRVLGDELYADIGLDIPYQIIGESNTYKKDKRAQNDF